MGNVPLRIVILYDAANNQYKVSAHNLTPDEANRLTQECKPPLALGRSLLTIGQSQRHQAQNPDQCRACRETVARTSGLNPQPKFRRTL